MASPTIESLCCLTSTNAFSKDFLIDFQSVPYNVVSIVASIFGIAGATYQILPRAPGTDAPRRSARLFKTRSRLIIKWLAASDLMASFGILVRSATWLSDDTFGSHADDTVAGQALCIITSGIIHYFYTVTYVWTFLYALDVQQVMHDRRISHRVYHLLAWLLPLALCLLGLLLLYLPDLNCHSQAVNPYLRFLPNYLSTFLPVLVVMVGNPVLYCLAFTRVEKQIMSARGRFTHTERRIVDGLLKKFFLINGVFYLCWLPNVINGIVLWTSWDHLPKAFIITVWYLMAILNPLQAVLNCLVYRSWEAGSVVVRPAWWPAALWPPSLWPRPASHHLTTTSNDTLDQFQTPEDESDVSPVHHSAPKMSHEQSPLLQHAFRHSRDESRHEMDYSSSGTRMYYS